MRFWRIEICHITDIYEKQKDYSVLKNEEKYMIEKVYDDNTLSFKEKGSGRERLYRCGNPVGFICQYKRIKEKTVGN